MTSSHTREINSKSILLILVLSCTWLTVSCGPSAEDRAAADSDCSQLASSRSGYNPGSAGDKSSVGKGAAIGAAGGAAVGAVSSKKSKKVVQGAAIGAAAGAGAGALKDSEDRKKAKQAAAAYKTEYQHCMKGKGF